MSLYNDLSRVFDIAKDANCVHLTCANPADFKKFIGVGRAFACHIESNGDAPTDVAFVQTDHASMNYTRQGFQLAFAIEGVIVNTATNMLANDGYLVCISHELTERTWLLYRRNFSDFDIYQHKKLLVIIARRKWHLDIEYDSKIDFYKKEFANHDRNYLTIAQCEKRHFVRAGKRIPEFYTGQDLPDVTNHAIRIFNYGKSQSKTDLPRPLMPASIGHLVQFIGMGALDNREILLGDTGYLVRGISTQVVNGKGVTNQTQFTVVAEKGEANRLNSPMELADWVIANPTALRDAISGAMQPQYDMHIEPAWGKVYDTIVINDQELLKTQELVITAMIERLLRHNYGFLLGSPSTGKTICSITIMYVLHLFGIYKHQHPELVESLCNRYGVRASDLKGLRAGCINIVYTPAILPQQWVGEFQKALGENVHIKIVTKPSELQEMAERAKSNPLVMHVVVLTYETLKLSDGIENAIMIRHDVEATGGKKPKMKPVKTEGEIMRYACDPVTGLIVRDYQGNRTGANRFAGKSTRRYYKGQYSTGEYVGLTFARDGNGDVIKNLGVPELQIATRPVTQSHGHALWQMKRTKKSVLRDGGLPLVGGKVFSKKGLTPTRSYKLAMCDAVKRLKNVGMIVVDEAHRIKSRESLAGIAVRKTFSMAQKVMLVTATFSSGTADSFFQLVYPFSSLLRQKYPYHGEAEFAREYGTIDANGKVQAGITDGALRFIIDATVFVDIPDLATAMPIFQELIANVEMSERQLELYNQATKEIEAYSASIMGNDLPVRALLWWCQSTILDQVHLAEIKYNHRQRNLTGAYDILRSFVFNGLGDEVTPKEIKMVELVMDTLKRGERAIVFTTQSDTRSILYRLATLLEAHGAKPFVMEASTRPLERHDYIMSHVNSGHNVLIANPKIVAEGINLVMFTDIVYFDVDTSTTIMVQSSKRTWRMSNKSPVVTVHYLAYNNTPQVKRLMRVAEKSAYMRSFQGILASDMDLETSGTDGYGALGREFAYAINPADVQKAFDEGQKTFGYENSVFNTPFSRKQYREHRPTIREEYLNFDEDEEI